MTTYTLILFGSVAIIFLYFVAIYNTLIARKNQVDEAWSDIEVQLKRRYDLIPNLINTVKAYAKHESNVFESVTKARSAAMQAKSLSEHTAAESMLSRAVGSIIAIGENYPELKASVNFLQLQDELKDAEDKIQAARRFYNGNVRDFNTSIQQFPQNIFARTLGFKPADYFELENSHERELPKVEF